MKRLIYTLPILTALTLCSCTTAEWGNAVEGVAQGVGDFSRGYAANQEEEQESRDAFSVNQKLEQIQWQQRQQFNEEQSQRAFDRLRDGLVP